jgi:hypothetical protein
VEAQAALKGVCCCSSCYSLQMATTHRSIAPPPRSITCAGQGGAANRKRRHVRVQKVARSIHASYLVLPSSCLLPHAFKALYANEHKKKMHSKRDSRCNALRCVHCRAPRRVCACAIATDTTTFASGCVVECATTYSRACSCRHVALPNGAAEGLLKDIWSLNAAQDL